VKQEILALGFIVLAVTGGVAYACSSTGSSGCRGDGSRGHQCPSTTLQWVGPSGGTPSAPNVVCSVSLNPETLSVQVSNLAPGQACAVSAGLLNPGKDPETVTEDVSMRSSRSCSLFAYSDNVPSSPPLTLGPAETFAFHATVGLAASAGNACEGASISIHVTLSAGSSNGCDTYGTSASPLAASVPLWDCGGGW
jgi:hypothetical protein